MSRSNELPRHTTATRAKAACFAALLALGCKERAAPGSTQAALTPAASSSSDANEATPPRTNEPAPSATVHVVSSDGERLDRPTTLAFRGRDAWISIGQLSALFGTGVSPRLPFRALSLSLDTGALGPGAVELPGADYHPEGIAAGPDGTLYIGSIMQGVIMRVPAASTRPEPFLPKGASQRGVIGLTVDSGRSMLWYCDSNPKLDEARKAGELVGVRLADAREVVRHALPKAGDKAPMCNDVIVSPAGDVWLTDSALGRVFRVARESALHANSAELWLDGGPVAPPPSGGSGANGIEWLEGKLVIANVGRGTLVRADPESSTPSQSARVVELREAGSDAPVTLCSPDGVERVPGSTNEVLVVENGGCSRKAPRIVRVRFD